MKKFIIRLMVLLFGLIISTTSAQAGLLAYYSFDGNTNDSSGNGYNGTVVDATLTGGYSGQAYNFDGAGDYISAPVNINPSVLPQMTMGAWVKADSANPVTQVISHDNGGFDRSLGIDYRGGSTGWSAFTGYGVLGGVPITLNDWTLIAVSYDRDANLAKLYVNGYETTTAAVNGAGWNYIRIGSNPSYGEYFDGLIDEVFIYDEYLTKAQLDGMRNPAVPEPATMVLFGAGLVGFVLRRRRA